MLSPPSVLDLASPVKTTPSPHRSADAESSGVAQVANVPHGGMWAVRSCSVMTSMVFYRGVFRSRFEEVKGGRIMLKTPSVGGAWHSHAVPPGGSLIGMFRIWLFPTFLALSPFYLFKAWAWWWLEPEPWRLGLCRRGHADWRWEYQGLSRFKGFRLDRVTVRVRVRVLKQIQNHAYFMIYLARLCTYCHACLNWAYEKSIYTWSWINELTCMCGLCIWEQA